MEVPNLILFYNGIVFVIKFTQRFIVSWEYTKNKNKCELIFKNVYNMFLHSEYNKKAINVKQDVFLSLKTIFLNKNAHFFHAVTFAGS